MADSFTALLMQTFFTLAVATFAWFARLAWKKLSETLDKAIHLDECMDGVKEAFAESQKQIKAHYADSQERDKAIADLRSEVAYATAFTHAAGLYSPYAMNCYVTNGAMAGEVVMLFGRGEADSNDTDVVLKAGSYMRALKLA